MTRLWCRKTLIMLALKGCVFDLAADGEDQIATAITEMAFPRLK